MAVEQNEGMVSGLGLGFKVSDRATKAVDHFEKQYFALLGSVDEGLENASQIEIGVWLDKCEQLANEATFSEIPDIQLYHDPLVELKAKLKNAPSNRPASVAGQHGSDAETEIIESQDWQAITLAIDNNRYHDLIAAAAAAHEKQYDNPDDSEIKALRVFTKVFPVMRYDQIKTDEIEIKICEIVDVAADLCIALHSLTVSHDGKATYINEAFKKIEESLELLGKEPYLTDEVRNNMNKFHIALSNEVSKVVEQSPELQTALKNLEPPSPPPPKIDGKGKGKAKAVALPAVKLPDVDQALVLVAPDGINKDRLSELIQIINEVKTNKVEHAIVKAKFEQVFGVGSARLEGPKDNLRFQLWNRYTTAAGLKNHYMMGLVTVQQYMKYDTKNRQQLLAEINKRLQTYKTQEALVTETNRDDIYKFLCERRDEYVAADMQLETNSQDKQINFRDAETMFEDSLKKKQVLARIDEYCKIYNKLFEEAVSAQRIDTQQGYYPCYVFSGFVVEIIKSLHSKYDPNDFQKQAPEHPSLELLQVLQTCPRADEAEVRKNIETCNKWMLNSELMQTMRQDLNVCFSFELQIATKVLDYMRNSFRGGFVWGYERYEEDGPAKTSFDKYQAQMHLLQHNFLLFTVDEADFDKYLKPLFDSVYDFIMNNKDAAVDMETEVTRVLCLPVFESKDKDTVTARKLKNYHTKFNKLQASFTLTGLGLNKRPYPEDGSGSESENPMEGFSSSTRRCLGVG